MTFADLVLADIFNFCQDPQVLQFIVNNRFILILFVIILLKLKYATYSSMWLSALINIPGTILHESMHFIIGWILNAFPTSFDLIPHRGENGGYVMGSVGFRNIRFYNALPSALAPLLLLIIGFYFNRWYFQNVDISLLNYTGYILLQTIIIENAIPSSTDFKVAFSYPAGLLLYGFIGVCLLVFSASPS